jgi:hypothetical protein
MPEISLHDRVVLALIDEGYVELGNDYEGSQRFKKDTGERLFDRCLVCKKDAPVIVTTEREMVSNDWSWENTLLSKEMAAHFSEKHSNILTLMSMRVMTGT